MLIPGEKIWKKLESERTGIWLVRPDNTNGIECVVKFPVAILKAAYKGVPSYLMVGAVEVGGVRVRYLGIRIDDDIRHPICTSHPSRFKAEQDMLEELLNVSQTKLHFFDERSRPMFSSQASLNKSQVEKVSGFLSNTGPHYIGPPSPIIERSHDFFQQITGLMTNNKLLGKLLFYEMIDLSLEHSSPIRVLEFERGEFLIDDADEGAGLEQSVHGALELIFPNNTYRSPEVIKGKAQRELTDFLAFSFKRICLVEAKALSIIGTELIRPTERRIKSIEKDIKKALRQLKGAIRKIRSNDDIFDKSGLKINIPNRGSSILHAMVLLSEINPFLDRQKLAHEVQKYTKFEENVFFHILDLEELQQLAINTQDEGVFSSNLLVRWVATLENEDILVRARRPPDRERTL